MSHETDHEEFRELIKDPAKACLYWKSHIKHLIALNQILDDFAKNIDALCNQKAVIDPITIKQRLKEMNKERAKLARKVKFGKRCLE